jgi:DNA-binding PadR family transcriptional regulator
LGQTFLSAGGAAFFDCRARFILDATYRGAIYSAFMSHAAPNPVEFQVLLALAEGPRHGYGIMQEIARQSDDSVQIGPGTLYGALKRMLKAGWVAEAAERAGEKDPRRTSRYRLTPAGRQVCSEGARRMAGLVAVAVRHGLVNAELAQ